MKGKCSDKDCRYYHPKDCWNFKKGKCEKGKSCQFRHLNKDAAGAHPAVDAQPKPKPKPKAKAKANAHTARLPLRFLLDPSPSLPSGILEELGSGKPEAGNGRLVFSLRDRRKVKFEKQDVAKAKRDETAPLYQPKNSQFVPHRTDADGNVRFDEQEDIEQHEHWARRKAIILREEVLEEEVDESTFYNGTTERDVYSIKPPTPVPTKAEKKRAKRLARSRKGRKNSMRFCLKSRCLILDLC